MRATRNILLWALAATVLSAILYLGLAQNTLRLGFPLDDAWIHQTYARNLARSGEWAFVPGDASAGSTAPLWSGYLSIGYLLGIGSLSWAYFGGLATLAFSGWLGARWFSTRNPGARRLAWVVALIIPLEWHLAWASLSGMETIALGALALLVFLLLERDGRDLALIGFLIGLGVWLRPEALLLAIVPIGSLLISVREQRLKGSLRFVAGLAIPLIFYGAFQRSLAGAWWPNTFFAKQAEYASLSSIPFGARLLAQVGIPGPWIGASELDTGGPLVGVLVVLIPGLAIATKRHVVARNWNRLLPLAWCLAHLAAYALRLPVTYQHGRYAIPVVPTLVVLAADGMLGWLELRSRTRKVRMLSQAWLSTSMLITLAFWALGARAYSRDVAIIESEMVETARWINANTPPSALIAVHDIGAIGYIANRDLIDLAGLVSPEVIPIIRDEAALARHLDQAGANYLVAFPGWYPELVADLQPAFVTGAQHSPQAGGENLVVYRWN